MSEKLKKIFIKFVKIIWTVAIILFCIVGIAECGNKQNKTKPAQTETKPAETISNKQPEKLYLTPEQEEIIKEDLALYNELSLSANSGEELEQLENQIHQLMCDKYNLTPKEYNNMWDIYNFGFILEN